MTDADVSVIICVRNGAKTIDRQLRALAGQVDAPAFELIISDNGSTDRTRAVVEEWMSGGTGAVVEVRMVDSGQKPGIPYARNQGALHAKGRLLAFCDADDVVRSTWVAAIRRGTPSGLGGGRVHAVRTDGRPEPGIFDDSLMRSVYLPHVSGCNFAITRNAFMAVGGFDESLPPYGCDDLKFSWRVQEAGHPIHYVPDAVVDFTITPRSRVVRKEFLMAKARVAVAARHPLSTNHRFTLSGSLIDVLRHWLRLPWRMVRPQGTPRSRWIRWAVDSAGRLAGYWAYCRPGASPRPQLLTSQPPP